MYNYDYYSDMPVSSNFNEKRIYGFHEGIDNYSRLNKKQDMYNLIDGPISEIGVHRAYGKYIIMFHNPKFINGPDDKLFATYAHLSHIDKEIVRASNEKRVRERFVAAGEIIGKMGNTGMCMTKMLNGKYRYLTKKEIENSNEWRGVHGHRDFFQHTAPGKITPIIQDMIDLKILNKDDYNDHILYQMQRLYINPEKIVEYFEMLKGLYSK